METLDYLRELEKRLGRRLDSLDSKMDTVNEIRTRVSLLEQRSDSHRDRLNAYAGLIKAIVLAAVALIIGSVWQFIVAGGLWPGDK